MHSIASSSSLPGPDFRDVVATTMSLLEQTPPPSLREILGAYSLKGDGDRDMLLAIINAKSAEDQRVASVAALQRTMLQVYQLPPVSPMSDQHSPPAHDQPLSADSHQRSLQRPTLPPIRSQQSLSASLPPRKRQRPLSRSPPSPRSSVSTSTSEPLGATDPAEYSPRTRQSMAIGSLLSAQPKDEPGDGHSSTGTAGQ